MNDFKLQIHSSDLRKLGMCAYLWQQDRGCYFGVWHQPEPDPPNVPIIIGQSNHDSGSHLLNIKKEIKSPPTLEEILDINRDSFEMQWQGGVYLAEDEAINIKVTHDRAVDLSASLAKLFHQQLAPEINPEEISKKFVIKMNGYPFDLAGEFDWTVPDGIEDLKTMSANKKSVRSIQMGTYSLAYKIEHKKYPEFVRHRKLIKTKTPTSDTEEAVPDDSWVKPVLHRVENIIMQIDAVKSGKLEHLPPADPDHWKCTKRYCPKFSNCPYWSGREK